MFQNISTTWSIPVVNSTELDSAKEVKKFNVFHFDTDIHDKMINNKTKVQLNLVSNFDSSFPVNFAYDQSPLDKEMGIIYAAIVLLGLYVLIIWELVHRTFAAMIASTMSIGN